MRMVSLKQSHAISGLVGTNVDWDQVPFEAGEGILADPTGFGERTTRFLQNGGKVAVTLTNGIIPPPGGRIQPLTVVVDESRPWGQVVKEAAPRTIKDSDIWHVGGQYPPIIGARSMLKQVFLANFGESPVESEQVLEWGSGQRLVLATPRTTFAVPERYSALDEHLGMNLMAVVTLKQCSLGGVRRVPCVWWGAAGRGARLDWSVDPWSLYCWFVFVPE